MDFMTSEPLLSSASVEEIPLLRDSPVKTSSPHTNDGSPRFRDSEFMAASPEVKVKLQGWLQRQQGTLQAKAKKRSGQVYTGPARHREEMLRRIEEEQDGYSGDEDEWESDYGESGSESGIGLGLGLGLKRERESVSGSEFSMATGMDSVKFVAECGGMF